MSSPAEPIGEYRGYKLFLPVSGGKAGKGHNKTTSLQIRQGNSIVKLIRFDMDDGHHEACDKARRWIDTNIPRIATGRSIV